MPDLSSRIAVVIPCYRVRDRVLDVIAGIGDLVSAIYVVDDGCPEGTGRHVEAHVNDTRVRVIWHDRNRGVGAAVMTGYRAALDDGADILVKIDGDGQMDPAELPRIVAPILDGTADYVKGNRFYNLARLRRMPVVRLVGNAALSFITKFSSGYWDIFDPTNGYTALHAAVARELPWSRMATGYFFESDMLHQLGLLRAVVRDVPQDARYGDEASGVRIVRAVARFSLQHAANTVRRLFYNYFLRDFSAASVELVLGTALLTFGVVFGATQWVTWTSRGVGAYAGTVMLAALPVIVGTQLVLAFLSFDVARVPREPLHPLLERRRRTEAAVRIAPPAAGARPG
jgi:glycosyltransferase involved in cell wall biosynthesis